MTGFAYLAYEDEISVPVIADANTVNEYDHSAVDFDHLRRFTLGNRSLEQEVLNLFRTQSELYMERLEKAADDVAWLEAAHTLKGSAAGIGAHKVREAAGQCERLTGDDRQSGGAAGLKRLRSTLDEANFLIASFLND